MLLTSSGTSLSLLSASRPPLLRLPRTLSFPRPSPLKPSPRPKVGALSPSASLAFTTAFRSRSRPSNTVSSCFVSLPPLVVIFLRSSICFCNLSGFRFASFSFRLVAASALPTNRSLVYFRCSVQPLISIYGQCLPFLICLAFSALRWAWTGLKFFSLGMVGFFARGIKNNSRHFPVIIDRVEQSVRNCVAIIRGRKYGLLEDV